MVNKVKRFLLGLIITMLITLPLFYFLIDKDDIHTAAPTDLVSINGIGTQLSQDIHNYITNNPNADIDDLISVKGIGEKKLALIKERYD